MSGTSTRRMRWLAAASLLATVGIVCLAVAVWRGNREWLAPAAFSPLALRCLVLMAGGLVVLGLMAVAMVRLEARGRTGHPRGLHGNQDGTAAIEFVLLLPVAVMVILVVTQSALLFNANVMVQYAGWATIRVATTVVPFTFGDELRNLVSNPDGGTSSEKLAMIRRAGAMALMPISGGISSSAASVGDSAGQAIRQETAAVFSHLGEKERHWFARIEPQYNYAWYYTQIEVAKPQHWRDGDPDPDCPYRNQERDEWTQWGWSYLPYCPFHPDRMDYYKWEDLHLRLVYQYLLEMPYAGRFLGTRASVPGYKGETYQAEIRAVQSLMNEGGPDPLPSD